MMTVDDFDFDLPAELIAQHPTAQRTASRLLYVQENGFEDRSFLDLPSFLNPKDLLVFNNTRVIRARFFGIKSSGGQVEVLIERILTDQVVLAQVRASKSPKTGVRIVLADQFEVEVLGREGEFFLLKLVNPDLDFWVLAERYGRLPLPPYIDHTADQFDEERYQTVYARQPGAVAAPTAGLHFDQSLLMQLTSIGVRSAFLTLHVGAGTFQPVRVQNIAEHRMHRELFEIPKETVELIDQTQQTGGQVVAVGTTTLRALESAAKGGVLKSGASETEIFITPGYQFQVVDRLITNFHLPRSTLLMLVSAFAGQGNIKAAYQHAITKNYRFFSYGDAMLLDKQGMA